MTTPDDEEARLRRTYASRDGEARAPYSWQQQEVLLEQFALNVAIAKALGSAGMTDLANLHILDVGCGTGRWLRVLLEWSGAPDHMHGIDLLADRIARSRALSPHLDIRVASGWHIPYADQSMDIVSAQTVLSSVVDPESRVLLAEEIARVLRPGGMILIYDFRIPNPRNPNTVAIRQAEVRRLFPGYLLHTRSLTLAPPLARRLRFLPPVVLGAFERLVPILRTHALYVLRPH